MREPTVVRRVLVANRGEIARRVLRTCRRLGLGTVAVHSDADANEPHVREAGTAVRLGPAAATDSYLRADAIVAAALATGADAIHPGYGFLAENAPFAEAVAAAGLTFIGPSPDVIRLMGDKAAAKRRLAAAGVPVVPGESRDDLGDDALVTAADEVGYPLLVKAVAGGGGKGMRAVHSPDELRDALAAARREAASAFGDDRLILERLVTRPRHVEVQVFGDQHGTVLHLLERECSIQRRHQKVVEETPSPALDAALRERMTTAAVAAASAVDYVGAGTVEFLVAGDTLDDEEPEFFFLEMNTRLQVEHPVTELVTGLDLVELQLLVAAGEPLPVSQDDIVADGHAIEVRLYAEDPVTQLPQTGTIERFQVPDAHDVRVDAGIDETSEVTPYYDPMLAKLIVHAPDRDRACQRLSWLLEHTTVHGVVTNRELLAAIAAQDAFTAGALTTGFLDEHLGDWEPGPTPLLAPLAAAVALQAAAEGRRRPGDPTAPWDSLGPFRPGLVGGWQLTLDDGDERHVVRLAGRGGHYRARVASDGADLAAVDDLDIVVRAAPDDDGVLHLDVDGTDSTARVTVVDTADRQSVWVDIEGSTRRLMVVPATHYADASEVHGTTAFTSPMPGAVLAVEVAAGTTVTAGSTLVVVEAMKMEHPVTAPADGTVTAVHVAPGDAVDAGGALVTFEPAGTAASSEEHDVAAS